MADKSHWKLIHLRNSNSNLVEHGFHEFIEEFFKCSRKSRSNILFLAVGSWIYVPDEFRNFFEER